MTFTCSILPHFSAVNTPKPTLILDCGKTYNSNGTINLYTVWQILEEDKAWLTETIDYFEVLVTLVNIRLSTASPLERHSAVTLDTNVSST